MISFKKIGYPFLFLSLCWSLAARPALGGDSSELTRLNELMAPRLEAGVKYMWDGYYDKAIVLFTQLENEFPDSPAGPLRKAEAIWWKILKADGDFNRLHEMDVLQSKKPPFEAEFNAAADKAIRLSEALVKKYKNSAQAYFSLGVANGLKSQMEGGKDNTLASARFAKKMKQNLDKCLALDPNFTDAYLELGLYNYYIGSLPALVNMLKFTIGLPAGDKRKGIEMVRRVKDKGGLLAAEARFYLASIDASPEQKKYQEAIGLVSELRKEFPHNPIFPLLLGLFYEKSGKPDLARNVYNEVIRLGQHQTDNYDAAILRRARASLKRVAGAE